MTPAGGCQCGAVRFVAEGLGRASICHCRMCQKAFGGFYGPYVEVEALVWTRGAPNYFQSSNLVRRGFCGACGTQLTFEAEGGPINIAIGAFDNPAAIPPTVQIGVESRLPYAGGLPTLPDEPLPHLDRVVSRQHPDHDTAVWPPK